MECNCAQHYMLVGTNETYDWSDDNYNFVIYENYECTSCGSREQVDVTSSYICENPFS